MGRINVEMKCYFICFEKDEERGRLLSVANDLLCWDLESFYLFGIYRCGVEWSLCVMQSIG